MNDKTPRNEEGQPPTKGGRDTVERLEEKKRNEAGRANKERIEDQERFLFGFRHAAVSPGMRTL